VKNTLSARPDEGPGGRPSPVDQVATTGATQVGRWLVHHLHGSAAELHHRPWPSPPGPSVWFLTVDRRALVLGSTQPEPVLPAGPVPGLDVVRRRSGGGAVLVEPGHANLLWVDVLIPAGDRHWNTDVGRAFLWLGDVWVAALDAAGVTGATVHRGAPRPTPLARTVCFAGLGTGEISVGGRKVVGICQRRTRDAALFQSAALLAWDVARVAATAGVAESDLEGVAAALPVGASAVEYGLLQLLHRS
jgi:lipoate-protein ligase A